MSTMLILVMVGATTASTLWIGRLVGAFWKPPDWLIGVLIAFASGALITALAFDLFQGSVETCGLIPSAIGLVVGTANFVIVDGIIDRNAESGSGLGLLASVTTDDVPENLALGVLLTGASVSGILALLVAISALNLPEALGGAAHMKDEGYSKRRIVGLWGATSVLLTMTTIVGNLRFQGRSEETFAIIRSIAAGAALASLVDELMPQA